jgi:N-acetylglucosaminyldiphosphoundecaprenol N-acetyl-beta-D-mannosaminyltransferase
MLARSISMKGQDQVQILAASLHALTMVSLLEELEEGVVFTTNVDHLVKLENDEEFRDAYRRADYRVCDSQIVLFASRFLGTPLPGRISGSDLFPAFCAHHKDNPAVLVFLLGSRPEIVSKASSSINSRAGRGLVVDFLSPSFGFEANDDENREIIEQINRSGATVLAVGVGAPKQEKWIIQHREKLPGIRIFMGIGATIDFEGGAVKRAPMWVSRLGLEWAYRLAREPRRLWRRYLVEDVVFFWKILEQRRGRYRSVAPDPLNHRV